MVSLVLFLLVYIGRGVFPAQLEMWRTAAAANVDFKAVFQQFGSALSQGKPVQGALEMLCVELLGGKVQEEEPPHSTSFEQNRSVILMSQIPGGGLAYWNEHGIFAGISVPQNRDEPMVDEPVPSEPEPSEAEPSEAVVVTAMAQEYTDDGVKLPRNVSFAFYELGLSETMVPVSGTATSGFGYRDHPVSGTNEFHLALDIGAAEGTEIGAFADGVVEYIGTSDEFGNYLKINHDNNVSTFYAHCSKLLVHKGDQVTCGQTVALVGQTGNATGPHLHLTIEKDNIRLDPAYYVDLS
ncbi:MAG: M23 family metallopeptidase [Oscillospiraceae bacterium]|nr:M23 family metallopeptidase [Oscillospiraceae bacterium]